MSSMDSKPEGFEDRIFSTLFYASDVANYDQEKYQAYQEELMTEKDYKHDLYYSRQEGIEEGEASGIEKGRVKGEKTKALEIAKTMISKGLAKDLIVEMTGLTEEEVESL